MHRRCAVKETPAAKFAPRYNVPDLVDFKLESNISYFPLLFRPLTKDVFLDESADSHGPCYVNNASMRC
jgi:hypothetical protein